MNKEFKELSLYDIKNDFNNLLFISKFLLNKKELKKERKILKEIIKDFDNENYDKYFREGDNYE